MKTTEENIKELSKFGKITYNKETGNGYISLYNQAPQHQIKLDNRVAPNRKQRRKLNKKEK